MKLSQSKGFTLLEALIASAVITFMVLGSVNLLMYIYKGTVSNTMKTHSLELAREHSEILRSRGFSSLPVTPDSCLPYPVSNLNYPSPCPSNPYPPETVTAGGRQMTVYKSVQYASEDDYGNIIPLTQSQVISTHAKQISIIVAYRDNNIDKLTEITTLVSDREVPISGSTISGKISYSTSGSPSSARVSIINRPEYSASAAADGTYIIRNVMPGVFNLYAEGPEFIPAEYAMNPVYVSDTAADYKNINITVTKITPAIIAGKLYYSEYEGFRYVTKTANGSVPGYASAWQFPSHINSDNNNSARSSSHNALLSTSFANAQRPNEEITSVRLIVVHRSLSASPGDSLGIHVFKTPPELYASEKSAGTPNPWAGTSTTFFDSISASTSWRTDYIDLTPLYTKTAWTWSAANELNVTFRSTAANGANPPSFNTWYIDYAALVIEYRARRTPFNCATLVWSDGSTSGAVTAPGTADYSITNINPSSSPSAAFALCRQGSKTYYGYVTGIAVSSGMTSPCDITLSESKPGEAYLTGRVLNNIDRTTGVPGITVAVSQEPPATAVTAADGSYIISGASTGSAVISAQANDYKSAGPPKSVLLMPGINEIPVIYVYETGKIGGRITETGTDAPLSGVMITAKASYGAGFDRFSSSSGADGYFVIDGVPAGGGYVLSAEPDDSVFTVESPALKYHSNITVSKGAMTSGRNFRLKRTAGFITGTVYAPSEKTRVFISAHPSGFSGSLPHQFTASSADYNAQAEDLRERRASPHYGCVADETGAFVLALPLGTSYSLYAYYSGVSHTAAGKEILKKYCVKTGVYPGDENISLSGPWNNY